MKKLSILFIVITLVFTACSKDDNSSAQTDVTITYDTSGDIIGTWRAVDVTELSGTITTDGNVTPVVITKEPYEGNFEITFSETPNTLVSQGTYSLSVSASIPDVFTLPYLLENENFPPGTTWSRSGDILSITDDQGTVDYDIIELTSTILRIKSTRSENIQYSGVSIPAEIIAVLVFDRL